MLNNRFVESWKRHSLGLDIGRSIDTICLPKAMAVSLMYSILYKAQMSHLYKQHVNYVACLTRCMQGLHMADDVCR